MIALLVLTSLLVPSFNGPTITENGLIYGLAYGPHAVGVRFEHTLDESRTIAAGGEKKPRPIQMTIWYPASPDESPTRMTVADYLGYKSSEFQGGNGDAAARAAAVEESKADPLGAGADNADIARIYATTTRATFNADPAAGKFPLLIYAPSYSESPSDNIALCEYLASHGYIVASCPSAGAKSRKMTGNAAGVRAQAADLAFVLKRMEDFEYADYSRIGTFGFSWGGMANVLFALDNENVKAVASLDGSLAFPNHRALVESIAEFRPEKLKVPYFYLSSYLRHFAEDPHDYFFIDAANNAERYVVKFRGVGHGNFCSSYVAVHPYLPKKVRLGVSAEFVRAGYRAICFYLLKFFDAHLKGDPAAKEVLTQTPENIGFEKGLISIKHW